MKASDVKLAISESHRGVPPMQIQRWIMLPEGGYKGSFAASLLKQIIPQLESSQI